MIAQILADEAKIEPNGSGSFSFRGAFQHRCGGSTVAILPCQPAEPRHRFATLWNDVQDRPPRRARLRPVIGLVKRSRLLEKHLPLRRDRHYTVEMGQCSV